MGKRRWWWLGRAFRAPFFRPSLPSLPSLTSAAEMNPLPSLSNTLNASRNSSSESASLALRAMSERNSGKSTVPDPSASTSATIS